MNQEIDGATTRIFRYGRDNWRFGHGTRNPQGDYYVEDDYQEPSVYSPGELQEFFPCGHWQLVKDEFFIDEGL